jgi:hypothetical protein
MVIFSFLQNHGIHSPIGCHTFRATGITQYLKNGGKLEHAQQIASHESPCTRLKQFYVLQEVNYCYESGDGSSQGRIRVSQQHATTLRFLAEPAHVNFGGKVHGGAVMKWIDQAGYACAAGWSGSYCVIVFVALGADSKPHPVPRWIPRTDHERLLEDYAIIDRCIDRFSSHGIKCEHEKNIYSHT